MGRAARRRACCIDPPCFGAGPAGDPADYKLDDCATQRNLSEQGRAEARALGERFRSQQVKIGKIISSQWCRCRQTAELMNIGPVEDAPLSIMPSY